MKILVFSIHDSAAECFKPPWCAPSKGIALRTFSDLANTEGNDISRYPRDFTLFELGTFDDQKATMELHRTPKSLGLALEYLTNVDPKGQIDASELDGSFKTQVGNEAPVLGDTES